MQQALYTTCGQTNMTGNFTVINGTIVGNTTEGNFTEDDDLDNQSASCADAINRLANNAVSCSSNNNPRVICTGWCRGYYDDIIDNCSPEVWL